MRISIYVNTGHTAVHIVPFFFFFKDLLRVMCGQAYSWILWLFLYGQTKMFDFSS